MKTRPQRVRVWPERAKPRPRVECARVESDGIDDEYVSIAAVPDALVRELLVPVGDCVAPPVRVVEKRRIPVEGDHGNQLVRSRELVDLACELKNRIVLCLVDPRPVTPAEVERAVDEHERDADCGNADGWMRRHPRPQEAGAEPSKCCERWSDRREVVVVLEVEVREDEDGRNRGEPDAQPEPALPSSDGCGNCRGDHHDPKEPEHG